MTLEPVVFSPCGQYRYVLRRRVGLSEGICLFIMLNPSTADATQDDPTIRRCIGFAQLWGYGILEVCNLFAWRSTNPQSLYKPPGSILLGTEEFDPIGFENDHFIAVAALNAHKVIAAWGNHGALHQRGTRVLELTAFAKYRRYHLGITKAGEPRHPLYVAKSLIPAPLL